MSAQHALVVGRNIVFSTKRAETLKIANQSDLSDAERVQQAKETLQGILDCAYSDHPRWPAVQANLEAAFSRLLASCPLTLGSVAEARERVCEGTKLAFQQVPDWERNLKQIFKVFGDRGLGKGLS